MLWCQDHNDLTLKYVVDLENCGDILGTEEDIEFSSFFYILGIFNPVDSLLNIGNIFNLVCRSTTPDYDMYELHFLSQKFYTLSKLARPPFSSWVRH